MNENKRSDSLVSIINYGEKGSPTTISSAPQLTLVGLNAIDPTTITISIFTIIIIRAGKAISSVYISEARFKKMHRSVDLNGILVIGF